MDVNARHRLVIEIGDIEQGEVGHILPAKVNGECQLGSIPEPESITEASASACRERGRWGDEIEEAEKDKTVMVDLEFWVMAQFIFTTIFSSSPPPNE